MSQIDTVRVSRPTPGAARRSETVPPRLRVAEARPVQGLAIVAPPDLDTAREATLPVDSLGSVHAVAASDLERLAGLHHDQLIGELIGIEHDLRGSIEVTEDEELRSSLETGLMAIGETIRRLRLVHQGIAALVLKP